MARKIEYIKQSEARIIIFLNVCSNYMKCGYRISSKLGIDYAYVMKLLEKMYAKGWVMTHQYNHTTYFYLTKDVPIEEAVKVQNNPQAKLKE